MSLPPLACPLTYKTFGPSTRVIFTVLIFTVSICGTRPLMHRFTSSHKLVLRSTRLERPKVCTRLVRTVLYCTVCTAALYKLACTCTSLLVLVQACSYLYKLACTCTSLLVLVQVLYKLIRASYNLYLYKLVQACPCLYRLVLVVQVLLLLSTSCYVASSC